MEDTKSVEELRQTLNILKKSLIMEREEKKESFKLLESLKSQQKAIEIAIGEKVIFTQNDIIEKSLHEKSMIDGELQKAEERIKNLGKNKGSQPKATATSRSIQALEQQNDKLLEEFNIMQRENKDDELKISKLKS